MKTESDFYPDNDLLDKYLEDIGKTDLLTREEEIELAKKIEEGDQVARHKLISSNLGLVIHFAKKYRKYLFGSDLSFFNLILEGNSGLIDAVEKFDWRRGYRFSTYAKERILNPIRKALYSKSRTIKIPKEQLREFHNLRKLFEELSRKLENSSDHNRRKKIAAEMNLLDKKLEEFHKKLPLNVLYLQHPVGDDDSLLEDFIEDFSLISAEEKLDKDNLAEKVRRILGENGLTPREEKVIRLIFGIGERSKLNRQEIGNRFGISRERVRQIEKKALLKLKKELKTLESGYR
ncbi:RNA polymerase sigma factor RpoD/SigA [bacterium]|nr:RNA polymerase sigma factor RpoD/SigA [bacterium]